MDLDDKTPEEILDELQEYCTKLGWEVAVEVDPETGAIFGGLIGITEYIQSIVLQLPESEQSNFKFYEMKAPAEDLH